MTISFIPGEVNDADTSVLHGKWRNHYIVAYGSGNNLIISTLTLHKEQLVEHLQTIYLQSDPVSISFNDINGFIALCLHNRIIVFKPMNEFMSKPQWLEAFTIDDNKADINCLQWAPIENELVIGTNKSIVLYKVFEEYGVWKYHQLWLQSQPLPVIGLRITYNSNRIIVRNSSFDGILKLWNRINFGPDNTLFELSYLPNPLGDFIVDFNWRYRVYDNSNNKITDESMANIKNITNYINNNNVSSDTLYTFSHDRIFKVWSTYEYSGHDHMKCWGQLNLPHAINVVVIDNFFLRNLNKNGNIDYDLLLAINSHGKVTLYKVLNISKIPHEFVKFEKLHQVLQLYNFNYLSVDINDVDIDEDVKGYEINSNPVLIPKITSLNDDNISIIFHNRLKKHIKLNSLHLKSLKFNLINKFQGHDKSIQKLVKSNPFYTHENILLSILNFPEINYLWEPIVLTKPTYKTLITKKFQINLRLIPTEQPDNRIIDAVIINDIHDSVKRHHLVITFDKLGQLALWSCNGSKEDRPGELLRYEVLQYNQPLVFSLIEVNLTLKYKEYILICIFALEIIKGWKITIHKTKLKIEMKKFPIAPLPSMTNLRKITRVESLVDQQDKDIVLVIDTEGLLKVYRMKYLNNTVEWLESFRLSTNITNCSKIVGSSIINKLAIIDETGMKLFIWDLKAEIMEFEHQFDETVRDIDWCLLDSASSKNVVLSIGFERYVLLFTELRYDYTNHIPAYAVVKKIDISDYTSHKIGDSIWINNGYLVIGCGNQFFIDDRWFELGSSGDAFLNSHINQLLKGVETTIFDISDIVRILNGPLPVFHPQFLIQLLYMNEFYIVKKIFIKLFQTLRKDEVIKWNLEIDLIDEILRTHLDLEDREDGDIFETFNENLVELLINQLTKISLPFITRHQQITLTNIIRITLLVNKYIKLVDENGLRFLIGFKLFLSSKQPSLNMRDVNFAIHSNNKDLLISIIEETYEKFTWDLVQNLKLVYWVNNFKLLEIIESIARNEFSQSRDPLGLVSLLYTTLNKKQILIGLWRTTSHKERDKMLKFLNNDFTQERWKVAAMKNAFALLGKHRYIDSAYFFLLAGKLDDCCSILNSKLNDFQLSLIVSKLYQFIKKPNETPNNKALIEKFLLNETIENGNKWINSWIYWEVNEYRLSIESLIKSPYDISSKQSVFKISDNLKLKLSANKFLNDDPGLILLYKSLKLRADIKDESLFLMKICKIYEKLGCDYLGLLLLKNWVFEYPVVKEKSVDAGIALSDKKLPPQVAFEEPDMSSFDFGF